MSTTPHPGFLVWNPAAGPPTYIHTGPTPEAAFESAVKEARRLANLHPGLRFFVMGPEGVCLRPKPEPIWTSMRISEASPEPLVPRHDRSRGRPADAEDDIPF